MEHRGFIALFIPVLIDAAETSAVGVKYSLSWVSGVSRIRPNLIRGVVLFKAMTPEICDLHTHTAFVLFGDPRQGCPLFPCILKPLAIAIRKNASLTGMTVWNGLYKMSFHAGTLENY